MRQLSPSQEVRQHLPHGCIPLAESHEKANRTMTMPFMKCGHLATAVLWERPVCVRCLTNEPILSREIDPSPPCLIGRKAVCRCGKAVPSMIDLPFFEYRGRGSRPAAERCGECGDHITTHGGPGVITHAFVPKGPAEFDGYYCGCLKDA